MLMAFCCQECHSLYIGDEHPMQLGLPLGVHRKGTVRLTTGQHADRTGILHINGVPMWTESFYVTYSLIPGVEWGLFANKTLKPSNQRPILEYKGRLIKEQSKSFKKALKRGYLIKFSEHTRREERARSNPVVGIEAYPYVKTGALERIGGFANHGTGEDANVRTDEQTYLDRGNGDGPRFYRIYMYARRVINRDEEILWDYGDAYWKT